jgi:two-component system nitrogen regulation sensor histidine kinase NtrY
VTVAILALTLAAAAAVFVLSRPLASAWFTLGLHPAVLDRLAASLDDQKRLAALDPAHTPVYRRRFEATATTLKRLRVLAYNRDRVIAHYQAALLVLVVLVLGLGGAAYAWHQARQEGRLGRLQEALASLAAGLPEVRVGERRRDLIGRIAAMVEETSLRMARDRRRLASLENLAAWQEAARRHAHEMRTPLTAARLELTRLRDRVAAEDAEAERLAASTLAELDRLGRFARAFTSFARLPSPRLEERDLARDVAEFAAAFAAAWPNLTLRVAPPMPPTPVDCDPEMLRQVLVNLCDNSSLAGGGTVTFALGRAAGGGAVLEVADEGPGIPAALLGHLFEPYRTTRRIGEGMGLGLAVSRKMLLDQGGDLELAASSAAGATFRLLLPPSRRQGRGGAAGG